MVINKWIIALCTLLILITVIVSGLYLSHVDLNIINPSVNSLPSSINGLSLKVPSDTYRDGDNLTAKEKMGAISVALNNSTVINDIQAYSNTAQYISIGNVTSADAIKADSIHTGFLNIPAKIAYVRIGFEGTQLPYYDNYIVLVDILSNRTLGLIKYSGKAAPVAYITIPPGSVWFYQMGGVYRVEPGNYTKITPSVRLNIDDVNTTYPIILSADNFEKFKNGSPYNALEYVDFMTNKSRIADGSHPIDILWTYNSTVIWGANVSISHALPVDEKYFNPRYYYLAIENKNVDKEINISYWEGI
jgi:hypothetical protein